MKSLLWLYLWTVVAFVVVNVAFAMGYREALEVF